MNAKNILDKYRKRMVVEAWLNSFFYGLIPGLIGVTVLSLLIWIFGWKTLWLIPLAFVLITAISTCIIYKTAFCPQLRKVAQRIDETGLEERVLTMVQLDGDESVLAKYQREDTLSALRNLNESEIQFRIATRAVLPCVICFCLGLAALLTATLSKQSLLDYLRSRNAVEENEVYFDVVYEVKDLKTGTICGELRQKILAGSDGSPVQAYANDGYVFIGWSDGYEEDYREDREVNESISVYAVFELLEIEEDDEEDPDDDQGKEKPENGQSGRNGHDENGTEAGGKSKAINQVIDGATYYGDLYSESLQNAQDDLNGSADIESDDEDISDNYFHDIAR